MTIINRQWPSQAILHTLQEKRTQWQQTQALDQVNHTRPLPNRYILTQIAHTLCAVLFPAHLGQAFKRPIVPLDNSTYLYDGQPSISKTQFDEALTALAQQVVLELKYMARVARGNRQNEQSKFDTPLSTHYVEQAHRIVEKFLASLPETLVNLETDAQAAYRGDPAAHSIDEVLLCYPGMLAIIYHRLAHTLFQLGAPVVARILAEISHSETGTDIHPGAQIGTHFFIDHGTGVVIGETAMIGQRVRIYQAVTLGAKRFPDDGTGSLQKNWSRHPIVEDDVVIYAGATILGRVTIGQGSVIGGNVWLTQSVPAHSRIAQAVNP